ncbi:hypothetical protein ACFYXS_06865 [Streptomyces sp. NPDC002574]|uniref:hypothetical protein n=1 Tax=Streptomyces sp. NPDC002574 TaxID=3364652 RepID=UPI003679B27F
MEANRWLAIVGAPIRLEGTGTIPTEIDSSCTAMGWVNPIARRSGTLDDTRMEVPVHFGPVQILIGPSAS